MLGHRTDLNKLPLKILRING